jgi:hypothetical protein
MTKGLGKDAFGKELIESLREAADHARRQPSAGVRVTKVKAPEVKAIGKSKATKGAVRK